MSRLEKRSWSPEAKDLVSVACNLCGRDDGRVVAHENGLPVRRCGCGLYYVSPRPTREELARFYAEYYPEESEPDWHRVMIDVFQRDAARIDSMVERPGRILDVGTGFGHFLDVMRGRGWEVAAVEWSKRAVERLRGHAVPVFEGALPEVELPQAHFDVVTASSVLEHVADPVGVLRAAHRCLRPGGWAMMRVPNVQLLAVFFLARPFRDFGPVRALLRAVRREIMDEENLFSVIDPPGHLFGFGARTLAAAFVRAGFRDVEVRGEPMQRRGTRLNAAIDGAVYGLAEGLHRASGGRIVLAPNVTATGRRPALGDGAHASR